MNDDELRKFLLDFEEARIPGSSRASETPTPGARTLRLLTVFAILFWSIGVVSVVGAICWVELDVFQRAEMKRAMDMGDAVQGAIQLLLSLIPVFIAAILTVTRIFMARIVRLRKVNGAWLEIFKQMQLDRKKGPE